MIEEVRARDAGTAGCEASRVFCATTASPPYDAGVLTATRALADYFEAAVRAGAPGKVRGELDFGRAAAPAERRRRRTSRIARWRPTALAELLAKIESGEITAASGKKVFATMFETGKRAAEIIAAEGLAQITRHRRHREDRARGGGEEARTTWRNIAPETKASSSFSSGK